ncbi:hypothetical protein AB1P65_10035 [Roseibium alexandrii]
MLRKLGYDVWYDAELTKMLRDADRVDWKAEIDRRIAASGLALILWSEGADQSARLVHELLLAHQTGKELVLSLDGIMPKRNLESLQVLDFDDFDAMEKSRNMPVLLAAIARRIGVPSGFENAEDMVAQAIDADFPFYRLGNIEIPATVLLGIPSETYASNEVSCHFKEEDHHLRSYYPQLLTRHYDDLLARAFAIHEVDPQKVRDNPLVRIDSFECLPEGPKDEKGPLVLNFSRTSYFQIWATNVAVDLPIQGAGDLHGNTARRLLCPDPTDLARSVLANNLSIETMVVSDKGKPTDQRSIIIRRRRISVAGYRGWYQSSASGHFALAHQKADGTPCPFVSAEREARQEIDYALDVTPDDFQLFGIVLKYQDLHPEFMGFFESHKSGQELVEAEARDLYEGKKYRINLDADEIVRHISANPWFPLSAVCVLYTGIHFLGRGPMERAARKIDPVPASRFHWGDFNRVRG